jgi:hypothetical protein
MQEAINDLLGVELADSIRARAFTKETLSGHLARQSKVGAGMVKKFFVGLRWLAIEAEDQAIVEACPAGHASPSNVRRKAPTSAVSQRENNPVSPVGQPSEPVPKRGDVESPTPKSERSPVPLTIPEGESRSANDSFKSALLGGDVLQVRIDHNWKPQDIRSTLRLLQLIERGELIPEAKDGDE